MNKFEQIGFLPADILVPKNGHHKWSIVACDQYTSEPEYWNKVEQLVADNPSALHMSFPEIYLELGDEDIRIAAINLNMQKYLDNGVFKTIENSFIYVERSVTGGKIRRGLIGIVDLEKYDYVNGSTSLIRATEGTVLERIPPRVKIRKDAPLEMPHIMLLIDDPQKTVIEPLDKTKLEKLYDFDLMQNSGHIQGYQVSSNERFAEALINLSEKNCAENPLLFAVGDGNHSLATAKECYEQIKASGEKNIENHPARFALVELVNIHDESLEFEPIHRVIFDCDPVDLLSKFEAFYKNQSSPHLPQTFAYIHDNKQGEVTINAPGSKLEVGTLQRFLDEYAKDHNIKIDYIHGDDVVKSLSAQVGNIGFILPPMQKSDLFKAVVSDGALPRKTFSMGEACDKRFYFECRKIK